MYSTVFIISMITEMKTINIGITPVIVNIDIFSLYVNPRKKLTNIFKPRLWLAGSVTACQSEVILEIRVEYHGIKHDFFS